MTSTATRRTARATAPVVFDTRVVTGSGGGPEKTLLNSPRFLEPLGYQMLCGYLYPPGDPGFAEIEKKAARYNAPLIAIPDRGPWDWRVVRDLLRECKRHDVAIWHGHDYKTNALGLLLNRFWPMRMVTTVHGWVTHTARAKAYYRIDRLCLPRYEKVICVSDDLYDICRSAGVPPGKCVVIENGIDTEEYTRGMSVAEAKGLLGLPAGELLVGGVGRLSREKGFDILIRAVHALRQGGLPVRLVLVGEGEERPRLESLIGELGLAEFVTLAGWQSDARGHFEAMDVFCLSSTLERLPNVLLEAMALGVPCVASRLAGVSTVMTDDADGLLVPPGDQQALTDALWRVLTAEATRDRYRRTARRTVEARYSFAGRMAKVRDLYDRLLGR